MNCVTNDFKSNKKCLHCHKLTKLKNFPFCSEKCKLADLHHWLAGNYVIATDESPSSD